MSTKPEKPQCSAWVYSDMWHPHQCSLNGVVERDGKQFCRRHDPEFIAAKREARELALRDKR